MSDAQDLRLPIHCVRCGKPLELRLAPPTSTTRALDASFACAFCHGENTHRLTGKIISVTAGHQVSPTHSRRH